MKFEQYSFSQEIKNNLAALGFKKPTDIQFKSIPAIMKGEDLFAVAQTGTGKTAAFAIPIIDKIQQIKKSSRAEVVRGLVMVPTRELAIQIERVFNKIAAKTKVRAFAVIGGSGLDEQAWRIDKGVDILIATPGRMFDLINQELLSLERIEFVVLDEADRMLEPSFIKDIEYVKKLIKVKHQTLFFSATLNQAIKKLAFSLVSSQAIRIQLSPKDPVSKNVFHRVLHVAMDDKRFFLEQFALDHPGKKMIVFVRTRVRAERVDRAMNRVGIECLVIHGEREQDERLAVMEEFRDGNATMLIATDVTARGIDIPDISYVINYDLPDIPENYVHRVGRTGRAFNKGIAISFCSEEEKEKLVAIEEYVSKPIEVIKMSKKSYKLTLEAEKTPFAWAAQLEEEMAFLSPKKEKKTKSKNKSKNKTSAKSSVKTKKGAKKK